MKKETIQERMSGDPFSLGLYEYEDEDEERGEIEVV